MDLSTNDVLFLLGAVELVACVGCALYWAVGRGTEARTDRQARRATRTTPAAHFTPAARSTPAARPATAPPVDGSPGPALSRHAEVARPGRWAEVDELGDTGRHHVPDELLHSPTYRLTAGLRARARVPEPASGPSYQVSGQSGRPADLLSDAG